MLLTDSDVGAVRSGGARRARVREHVLITAANPGLSALLAVGRTLRRTPTRRALIPAYSRLEIALR